MVIAPLAALAAAMAAPVPVRSDGPFKVTMEVPASLPSHTLYMPRAIATRRPQPWPLLVWANGGCANAGNTDAPLLGEIASYGYVVIAIGPIEALKPLPAPAVPKSPSDLRKLVEESRLRPPATNAGQLSQAIDWATQADRAGPLRGAIDLSHIAAAGHSCGGLQAIAASVADPRIRTTIMLNSGIFEQPAVPIDKSALDRLHGPIAYFIGGPDDMAHDNAEDDYAHISKVPVLKVVNGYGHGGRLQDQFGGPTASWMVRWLDWQLKGDASAAATFIGPDCGICRTPGVKVSRKGLAETEASVSAQAAR